MIGRVQRAFTEVYGSSPDVWRHYAERLAVKLEERASNIPPAAPGKPIPPVTYLLYVKRNTRFDVSMLLNVILSDKHLDAFVSETATMQSNAKIQTVLDVKNFKAEVEAFGNIHEAITDPHLEVSALYRYMAALQQGHLSSITPKLIQDAVYQLRCNPYLYFAYGEDHLELMPIPWEGL